MPNNFDVRRSYSGMALLVPRVWHLVVVRAVPMIGADIYRGLYDTQTEQEIHYTKATFVREGHDALKEDMV